jgi:hypothetical protein
VYWTEKKHPPGPGNEFIDKNEGRRAQQETAKRFASSLPRPYPKPNEAQNLTRREMANSCSTNITSKLNSHMKTERGEPPLHEAFAATLHIFQKAHSLGCVKRYLGILAPTPTQTNNNKKKKKRGRLQMQYKHTNLHLLFQEREISHIKVATREPYQKKDEERN